MSVPNQFAEIDRPSKCEVEYLDYNGNKQNLKAEGLLATCIQHEMDHLEGILFIDYLSKLKKEIIIKKLSKQRVKARSNYCLITCLKKLFLWAPHFLLCIF